MTANATNPYAPPKDVAFYAVDWTRAPWSLVVRDIGAQYCDPFARLYALLALVPLKFFRQPGLPQWATTRPDESIFVEEETLPPQVRHRLDCVMAQAGECGVEFICFVKAPYIGNMSQYSAFFLSNDGGFYGSSTVMRRGFGKDVETILAHSCGTSLKEGRSVETTNCTNDLRLTLNFANSKAHYLPSDASLLDVIQEHVSRLASIERQDVIPSDRTLSPQGILSEATAEFDALVNRRFYYRISAEDVARLLAESQGAAATTRAL
jgi:hypothetical protein